MRLTNRWGVGVGRGLFRLMKGSARRARRRRLAVNLSVIRIKCMFISQKNSPFLLLVSNKYFKKYRKNNISSPLSAVEFEESVGRCEVG